MSTKFKSKYHNFRISIQLIMGAYIASLSVLTGAQSLNSKSPMQMIHGDAPHDRAPKNTYRAELYELLMDATLEDYGPYEIKSYSDATASRRQAQLLSEGKYLNVHWASPGTPIAEAQVIQIPVDIQLGLLGYRVCLTSTINSINWIDISDQTKIKSLRVGQVDSWPDFEIYRYNQINSIGTPSFDGLFDMLAANRLDCIALGVEEIGVIYRQKKELYANLRIEDNLLIYYDFPVYLYVSKNNPLLAKRLQQGFEIIVKNGQFEALFKKHFSQDLSQLNLSKRSLVCLESPYGHNADQCTNSKLTKRKLLNIYGALEKTPR